MTQIYLVRHAEAEGNLYRRIHGQYDSLVTERGYQQIKALEERFAPIPVDAVYSSDLFRTRETAGAVSRPKGLTLHTDRRLREIALGDLEDMTWSEAARRKPESLRLFESSSSRFRADGGESYREVMDRMLSALRDIIAAVPNGTAAIFSHGMAIRCLLAAVRGWQPEDMARIPHSDNTAVTLLEAESPEKIRIVYESDGSHLEADGLSTFAHQSWWREEDGAEHRDVDFWFRPLDMEREEERTLYRESRREAWRTIHGTMDRYDEASFVRAAEHGLVYSAMDGETPAGVLQLSPDFRAEEKVGMIAFYYMTPEYRHKGLGVQLLGQAISVYRPMGRERLLLRCAPENAVAQHFYRKYGFHKVGDVPDSAVPLEYLEKKIGF